MKSIQDGNSRVKSVGKAWRFGTAVAITIIAAAGILTGACSLGKTTAGINKDGSGIALKGYDPVAYFNSTIPRQGAAEYSYEWNGAKWRFSNAANRDLFAKEPEKYAPQYGGYCAYAVSQGGTADIDPQTGRIVDGKLYLNYSKDVASKWGENIPKYITDADNNWKNLAGNPEAARKDK